MSCKCDVQIDRFSYDSGYTVEHERFIGSEKAEILFQTHTQASAELTVKTLCQHRANNLMHGTGFTYHITIDGITKHFICNQTERIRSELGIHTIILHGFIEEVPKVELGY